MKLRAQINIDLSARGFADAAAHQHLLEQLLVSIRQSYPEATLLLRERRERKIATEPLVAEAQVLSLNQVRGTR